MADFEPYDHVKWRTPAGEVRGEVMQKITTDTEVEGLLISATPDAPRYIVHSALSNETVVCTPDMLEKI